MSGKLIVFEGPDAVGRSSVSAGTALWLQDRGEPCLVVSFPGKESGTLRRLVYDIHHEPLRFGVTRMTAASRQLLHTAARMDAIESVIAPALEAGTHVLLDRYWWSTAAYGAADGLGRRVLRRMIELEKAQWGRIVPALVVLFHCDGPVNRDDDTEHWTALQREYDTVAERERSLYPVVLVEDAIDCDSAIASVVAHIEKRLTPACGALFDGEADSNSAQLQLPLSSTLSAQSDQAPYSVSHIAPAVPSAVYDTYWRFAAERQQIFFRRLEGLPAPWTEDQILAQHKFTNCYRASDRVSQHLIRRVIYRDDLPNSAEEVFFRIILFKLFNKVETWELLEKHIGTITYSDYSFDRYEPILTAAQASGVRIYSAAYIMPPGRGAFGETAKHRNHLRLLESMMVDELPQRLSSARSMQRSFELLHAYPTVGNFLAYQFATDVNYSEITDFSEMDFVMPGPGALDGIRKCFVDLGGLNEPEMIRFMADRQELEFVRLGLDFRQLWGRPLQLVDCQNLFCEVDKYARVAHPEVAGRTGRTRIKQRFSPSTRPLTYWYPPKWGINDAVGAAPLASEGRVQGPVA